MPTKIYALFLLLIILCSLMIYPQQWAWITLIAHSKLQQLIKPSCVGLTLRFKTNSTGLLLGSADTNLALKHTMWLHLQWDGYSLSLPYFWYFSSCFLWVSFNVSLSFFSSFILPKPQVEKMAWAICQSKQQNLANSNIWLGTMTFYSATWSNWCW